MHIATRNESPTLFEDTEVLAPHLDECIHEAAAIALKLGEIAIQFAAIERVPRYTEMTRENDAEHSFMLSLMATEIAARYFPELDAGLVSQFSIVHDLVELETEDEATFTLSDAEIAQKEAREHAALDTVCAKLPPYTSRLLRRYELQIEPESRFVRLVDKIAPVITDIVGPGRKVMEEDYGIFTGSQLDTNEARLSAKLRERFPDPGLAILHLIRDELAEHFSVSFRESEQEIA